MLTKFKSFFVTEPVYRPLETAPALKIVMTQGCVRAIHECLKPEIYKRHEGIAYLLGQTDGKTTLLVSAMRPPTTLTTYGSFHVPPLAMAKIVRAACNRGLQVAGQIHTHPGEAYHSDGDDEGARMAYSGYASLVLPDHGRHLPNLTGMASFMYQSGRKSFEEVSAEDVTVIPEVLE